MVKKMNNTVLHVYPSSFKYESRMLKETKSLVDSGLVDRVFIGAIWESGVNEHEKIDSKREVWRVPLKTRWLPDGTFCKSLKHSEWILRTFLRFRKEGIRVVQCHNLSSLPMGMLFKIFVKSKVVYDAHELETERAGWSGFRRIMAKVLERILIYNVDSVLVVSDSIAKWYRDMYSLENVHVIKNVPYKHGNRSGYSNVLKERFAIPDDEILFIYQGLLGIGRGIEILLSVFSKADSKKHIVFMGFGDLENIVKEYANNFPNIHFHPAVKPEDVISYTESADVGVSLIESISLSYQITIPNKVFEYILSGLPLIVNDDSPDVGAIIDGYKCGWRVSVDEKSVLELIENISKEDIKEKRNNVLKCKYDFSWDKEVNKLLGIYHHHLATLQY